MDTYTILATLLGLNSIATLILFIQNLETKRALEKIKKITRVK